MPTKPEGSDSDKLGGSVPSNKGRNPAKPAISDDALAALEQHYGVAQNDVDRNESDSASATGFAAILAQGGGGGGSGVGSSGSMAAIGVSGDPLRRDIGEIPEAKIIAVRPDVSAPPEVDSTDAPIPTDSASTDASASEESASEVSASEVSGVEATIYASAPVEDVDDPVLSDVPTNASRPPVAATVPFKRSTGMPEHYKTLIPILAAMGVVALGIGIWAVVRLTTGHAGSGNSSATGRSSPYHLFSLIALVGLPLGLVMLGLTGFIFKRYWKKG